MYYFTLLLLLLNFVLNHLLKIVFLIEKLINLDGFSIVFNRQLVRLN